MELSYPEIEHLYNLMKEFQADALENRERLQLRQLEKFLVERINRLELSQAQARAYNPHSPNLIVEGLEEDKMYLEKVVGILEQSEPKVSRLKSQKAFMSSNPSESQNPLQFAENYIASTVEQSYTIHKEAYFKKYPTHNIEQFQKVESLFLKKKIAEYMADKTNDELDIQICLRQMEVLEYIKSMQGEIPTIKTKSEKIKSELHKYGFFELPNVKSLSEPNKHKLVLLISTNPLPYGIAMLQYLNFLKHLKTEHFATDEILFKEVAKWFGVTNRAVKGNFYVLNEHSNENRTRYTAHKQKEIVKNDYEKLI
jgi:hypothetical protein